MRPGGPISPGGPMPRLMPMRACQGGALVDRLRDCTFVRARLGSRAMGYSSRSPARICRAGTSFLQSHWDSIQRRGESYHLPHWGHRIGGVDPCEEPQQRDPVLA